jgi:pimeloyl-ACP methyl ester carboxylesterase
MGNPSRYSQASGGARLRVVESAPVRIAPDWEPRIPRRQRVLTNWNDYLALANRIVGRFHNQFRLSHFDYVHPSRLQVGVPRRFRRPYSIKVAYTDWGPRDAPVLVCCGGVVNTAMRFNYLAADLSDSFRVVCMDWLGRGRSAWMADERDYSLATCVEQLRQMIGHIGAGPVTVLGSSLGGSTAIELAARYPKLVRGLILNDVGPYISSARRKRRAETLARHYVFRDPADLLRRIGASQKNDGPISDDIRFNLTFHQTRWSEADGGRIYRHDVRALQAYRSDARESLRQWSQWERIGCPIMVIHGLQSDVLIEPIIRRMRRDKALTVMQVPDTGHTPVLADRNQIWFIRDWLLGSTAATGAWAVLHASNREPFEGSPIPFAPASALR